MFQPIRIRYVSPRSNRRNRLSFRHVSVYRREGDEYDMNQKVFCFFSQVSLFKSFMKSVFIFAHLFKITLFMVCRLLASPEIQNEYKYFP